ncbi:MAG: bestrophin family ion channel, partial [Myxococcota bacterium]
TARQFPIKRFFMWTWRSALRALPVCVALCLVWELTSIRWLQMPVMFVSVLATAVSFYLGFKGNSAYDRLWEARKIWGGIVNTSRTWAIHVVGFVAVDHPDAERLRRELVYRHIAWLAALRIQLRRPKPWEHNQPLNDEARERWGTLDTSDERLADLVERFLGAEETAWLMQQGNKASQLLRRQSEQLRQLHRDGHIDNFRHMELARLLETLFTHQGKAERIKNFPLPRQYATGANLFVALFIQTVPFAMVPLCAELGPHLLWLALPASMTISWVFSTWDVIVDYTENPFEGLISDIPMTSMSRGIEIDIRQMLDETELPKPIPAMDHVVM